MRNRYPGKKIDSYGANIVKKVVTFKDIYRLLELGRFVKPCYQGALLDEKCKSMKKAYLKNPAYLHVKDIITIVDLNSTLYIIDGQHRVEMARELYIESNINDYLIFNYIPIKNELEAMVLFDELNKDSHKNELYITSSTFNKMKSTELKKELSNYCGHLFSKRKTKKGKIKSLDEFISELLEIDYFTSLSNDDMYDKLMNYNKSFYDKNNYLTLVQSNENIFYNSEVKSIKEKCIFSIKGTNFIKYIQSNGVITPEHIWKKAKKRITRKIKTLVWRKEFKNKSIGKCPIPFCLTMLSFDSFNCGHIHSEANGGINVVHNLRPICSRCNSAMGSMNWDIYELECKKIAMDFENYSSDFESDG